MTKNQNDPSIKQWEKLYDLADKIKSLEPWKYFLEMDIIEVAPPGEEPYYCSVMGSRNECNGIAIYRGKNGLAKFCKLMTETELPEFFGRNLLDAMALYWGDREELAPVDRKVIKSLGRSYRGRGEWPYFREFSPGLYPWYFTATDAEAAGEALEQVHEGIKDVLDSHSERILDEGKRICRRYNSTIGEWQSVTEPFVTEVEAETEACMITDELMLRRLLKKKRINSELEYDVPYIPFPIKGKKGQRPYYPRIAVLADCVRGNIEIQYPFEAGDDLHSIVLWILSEYIEQTGRPKIIHVRDELFLGIISDFCKKLKIDVDMCGTLEVVDEYLESLLEDISLGE